MRKGKRTQHHHRQTDSPKQKKNATGLQAKQFRIFKGEPSEGGDQRDRNIGDHRHLQQHDEGIARDLEEPYLLAEKDTGRNAQDQADHYLFC